jgi:hypothetical protein
MDDVASGQIGTRAHRITVRMVGTLDSRFDHLEPRGKRPLTSSGLLTRAVSYGEARLGQDPAVESQLHAPFADHSW